MLKEEENANQKLRKHFFFLRRVWRVKIAREIDRAKGRREHRGNGKIREERTEVQ